MQNKKSSTSANILTYIDKTYGMVYLVWSYRCQWPIHKVFQCFTIYLSSPAFQVEKSNVWNDFIHFDWWNLISYTYKEIKLSSTQIINVRSKMFHNMQKFTASPCLCHYMSAKYQKLWRHIFSINWKWLEIHEDFC